MGDVRAVLKGVPVMALTATATKDVQEVAVKKLHLKKTKVVKGSLDRRNIFLVCKKVSTMKITPQQQPPTALVPVGHYQAVSTLGVHASSGQVTLRPESWRSDIKTLLLLKREEVVIDIANMTRKDSGTTSSAAKSAQKQQARGVKNTKMYEALNRSMQELALKTPTVHPGLHMRRTIRDFSSAQATSKGASKRASPMV
ncbi:hypothetical protein Bbelb_186890 [Branchiostoma belcheri]|nr:hypothetical protein Bbelb_186890 [Branchiostoma belcheri]